MDWQAAIDRHGETLRLILSPIFAMFGRGLAEELCAAGACAADRPTLARHRHRALLRVLRPAEAAVRRLVVILALAFPAAPGKARPARAPKPPEGRPPRAHQPRQPAGTSVFLPVGSTGTGIVPMRFVSPHPSLGLACGWPTPGGAGALPDWALPPPPKPPRPLRLPLTDPVRRTRVRRVKWRDMPRIVTPGVTPWVPRPVPRPPQPDDRVDATRLSLRIEALAAALDDLPREARRFLRWRARRAARFERDPRDGPVRPGDCHSEPRAAMAVAAARRARYLSPLRSGRPPGGRRLFDRALRDVRDELHLLARDLLARCDTS